MRTFRTVWLPTILLVTTAVLQAAYAGDFVVVVSAKSATGTLTAQEISDMYLGKSSAKTPIDNASAVRAQFYAKVAGKDDAQVRAIWAKLVFTGKATPPRELSTSADVVKAVAADANAIGYVEKTAVDASVKVVFDPK